MDKYKKLMCVKGLIMSLDEQLYQEKQKDGSKQVLETITNEYYKAIINFLTERNTDVQKA